jgi:hypothetical protein
MAKLNLDARRAARSEAENEPHEVVLGGHTFLLKPRMPIDYMDLLIANQLSAALRILLVDPSQWDMFRMGEPDNEDLEAITELYSVSPPESDGSASSSTNGGSSSKLTLPSDITSTSVRRAMDQAASGSAASSP